MQLASNIDTDQEKDDPSAFQSGHPVAGPRSPGKQASRVIDIGPSVGGGGIGTAAGGMMGVVANGTRPPSGPGCLGTIVGVVVLAAVVVLVLVIGFVALGVVAALLVIGLLALGVDRILLALSPKRRERRAARSAGFVWQSGEVASGTVIDTTAIDTTEPPPGYGAGDPGAEGPKPE